MRYATSYYGSQSKETMNVVTPFIEEKYVDITSGGSSYPYQLMYNKIHIGVNDRCYYSYLNSKIVFNTPSDQLILYKDVDNFDGYLSNKSGMEKYFSPKLARYIDALCQTNDFTRALVGRVLVSKFTFRGFGWAKKMVNGRDTNQYTVEEFKKDLQRQEVRMKAFHDQIDQKNCIDVTNLDALQSLNILDIKDAVVYTDPAWPWTGNTAPNPYKFFTDDVSSILMQDDAPQPIFWDAKSDEQIINEVVSWIQTALNKGAKYFILSTQSTNRPDPESMYAIINEKVHLHQYIVKDAWSFGSHKHFNEYFGVYSIC